MYQSKEHFFSPHKAQARSHNGYINGPLQDNNAHGKVDYGLIAYGSVAKTNLAKIDAVLRGALRLILGAAKSTPVEHLYAEL